MAPPPPSPTHIIRTHNHPVNALAFSANNERLYSGDASGLVTITNTRSLRAIATWNAHTDGLLGIEEWASKHEGNPITFITHGRDNKLHVWFFSDPDDDHAIRTSATTTTKATSLPVLTYSMDVNALNYCQFSLLRLKTSSKTLRAMIAVPNLVDSSFADVWALPEIERVHAAIGKAGLPDASIYSPASDGRNANKTGIIMSLHLFHVPHSSGSEPSQLRLLVAYESGEVCLFEYSNTQKERSVEGVGWDKLWSSKLHVETVMAMSVTRDSQLALTVSADNLIGRYDTLDKDGSDDVSERFTAHRTKQPGNNAVSLRPDGRVCAVAGWDGRIRLFSTKSMKPLGTLQYHKEACQSLAFANPVNQSSDVTEDNDDSDDEMTLEEKNQRSHWLVTGGGDKKVAIWALTDFTKP